MALVTVQRSPSVSSSPQSSDSGAGAPADDEDTTRSCKSLSECYFAGKGAALVLPPNERARPSRRVSAAGCDIQQHLQSMFYLLRPEETLKMAVKLESVHPGRTRYLVVVSCTGRQDEESCLLGIDCHARATVGLVLRVLADTAITLDGDGGFKVSVCGRQHIFKPVSVQAMCSGKAGSLLVSSGINELRVDSRSEPVSGRMTNTRTRNDTSLYDEAASIATIISRTYLEMFLQESDLFI